MSDLSRAEAHRDRLLDLPDAYSIAQECEIRAAAIDLAEHAFDRLDKESLRSEWVEAHWPDYRDAAIDQLGLV